MIKGLLALLLISSLGILGNSLISNAQNITENSKIDIEPSTLDINKIVKDVEPSIKVEYQSNSMVVLNADEDFLLLLNGTLTSFWHAIDIVKKHGYSLTEITESGMGSKGNPTRFYAVLEK
jgi:hypothetical protein